MPGGPTSRKPRGMRAPAASKRAGSWRNSTTSASSSTASSQPTTSVKRVVGMSVTSVLVLVKALAVPGPPTPPMAPFLDMNTKKPTMSATGRSVISRELRMFGLEMASVVKGTSDSSRRFTSSPPKRSG